MKIIHIREETIPLFNNKKREFLKRNGEVLIKYYLDGCVHCQQLENDWEQLHQMLSKKKALDENMLLANINAQALRPHDPQLNAPFVNAFPTIALIKKDGNVTHFNGNRTALEMKDWVLANSDLGRRKKTRRRPLSPRTRRRKVANRCKGLSRRTGRGRGRGRR